MGSPALAAAAVPFTQEELFARILDLAIKKMGENNSHAVRESALRKIAAAHLAAVKIFEAGPPTLPAPLDKDAKLPEGLRQLEQEIIGKRRERLMEDFLNDVARPYYDITGSWDMSMALIKLTIVSPPEVKADEAA